MELQELIDYCLAREGSVVEFPFGDKPVCIKMNGRIVAEIWPDPDDYKITLRCEPGAGELYCEKYPGIVVPGYHVPLRQRRFKNTVWLDRGLAWDDLKEMIDHSFDCR